MIYLFDKSQKLIGFLNEKEELTKAQLTLKINEAATLDLELLANSENLSEVQNVKYVAVPYPDDNKKLLFLQVMTRTDEQDVVTLMAKEYAYQELSTSGYIKDKRYKSANARTLMTGALSNSGYTLKNVNVSGSTTTNFYYIDYLTAISNVIDLLGGEIKFYVTVDGNKISGKYVDYVIAQGINTSKVFAYGSNLISIEKQSDASSVYTAILPRGKGELVSENDNGPDGYGRRITIEGVTWTKPTNPLNKPAGSPILEDPSATAAFGQVNGTARLLLQTYEDIDSPQELIKVAYKDLQSYNHPAVQFTASVANIGESGLGDTIVIMHSERGMSYRTRIFQIEYDLIELGNTVATFGDNLSKNNTSSMLANVSRAVDNVKEVANNAIISANSINNNYYGQAEPANPKNGDTWFYTDGEGFGIRQYVNGQWVDYVNSNTSEQIASQVDVAIKNAQSYADSLDKKQSEATQSISSDLAKKADELTKGQQNIASQATAYTDSAVADANAKAAQIGQTTAQNAQKALDDKATTLQQSIDTKVANTDYNQKTGELTASVNTAQQTADTATQTIGTYKETNDKRIHAAETNIQANSDAIKSTVSKTELNEATGKLSGDISTLQQRADSFDITVTKVNNLAVGGRNFLLGTGDWSGGSDRWEYRTSQIDGTYREMVISATSNAWGNNAYRIQNSEVLQIGKTYTFSVYVRNTSDTDATIGYYYDANVISPHGVEQKLPAHSDWKRISGTFKVISDPTKSFNVLSWQSINDVTNGQIQFAGYKLEEGNVPTDWTPAPEDVDTKLAQVKITADGVYNVVSDPTTGLSTRMQTAEGALSKVQGIDIPALKNATFWQSYSSLNFNDYTKQGSFFFNTTAVKTNGPVSGNNSWLYLIVDQGTSDNSRIKQTAWYDGVTGVKVTYVRTLNSGTWSPWYANDNDSVTTIIQTNSSIKQEISDRKTGDNNTLQSSKDFTTSQITSYDTGMQSRLSQVSDGIMAQVSAINLVTDSSFINGIANWNKFGNGVWAVDGSNSYYGINFVAFNDFNHTDKYSYLVSQNVYTNTFPGKKIYAYVDVNVARTGGSDNDFVEVYIFQYDNSGKQLHWNSISSQIKWSTNGWKRYTQEIDIDASTTYFTIGYQAVGNIEAYIARPYAGVTQLTENGYIAGPNNNNKTNLSLFYNFFSLGIQSNTGALISGINGDDSGLNIVGKKITVSGDTTFIGKNFMDGAIIKNASIGSAQIADAAITNAKISNLDVNKLSGNISSFIQTNWNGKYGSTSIDANGMTVGTSGITTRFNSYGMALNMTGESVGGIGVQGLTGKPSDYQGLAFWLDGDAEYMAWGARNDGVTSGNPELKLSWFRDNSAPTNAYSGFNFDDDVVFNKGINVPGDANRKLGFATKQFNSFNYPYFGESGLQAGLAYGTAYTYLISGNTYYNLTRVIKALDNLGSVKIPSEIRSDGTVAKWFNVTL